MILLPELNQVPLIQVPLSFLLAPCDKIMVDEEETLNHPTSF